MKITKKFYFFNTRWRTYPRWGQWCLSIAIGILIVFPQFIFPDLWFGIPGVVLYLIGLAYLVWSATRKNALHWKRDDQVKLKIDGKTIELDMKFISQVWVEDQHLLIRRINRVDSFPIHQLRPADLDKLVVILKEYE
tara:strand:- start:141 stop:551 length:411 start_codon:yes stop_codon:yes gene_type:complete